MLILVFKRHCKNTNNNLFVQNYLPYFAYFFTCVKYDLAQCQINITFLTFCFLSDILIKFIQSLLKSWHPVGV